MYSFFILPGDTFLSISCCSSMQRPFPGSRHVRVWEGASQGGGAENLTKMYSRGVVAWSWWFGIMMAVDVDDEMLVVDDGGGGMMLGGWDWWHVSRWDCREFRFPGVFPLVCHSFRGAPCMFFFGQESKVVFCLKTGAPWHVLCLSYLSCFCPP